MELLEGMKFKHIACVDFKNKSTGGNRGSVSISADTDFICDKYEPIPISKKQQSLSGKQIKNMMKQAKKGRL